MKKFKVYYCYMIDGVWEHTEIVEAENWQEARRAILKKLNLTNVNELDYINEKEVKNMKITAKVVYKDNTHKQMMFWFDAWTNSYKQFIEEKNKRMVDFEYDRLYTATDLLYFTGCINHERKKYMEHEINKMRGWA